MKDNKLSYYISDHFGEIVEVKCEVCHHVVGTFDMTEKCYIRLPSCPNCRNHVSMYLLSTVGKFRIIHKKEFNPNKWYDDELEFLAEFMDKYTAEELSAMLQKSRQSVCEKRRMLNART